LEISPLFSLILSSFFFKIVLFFFKGLISLLELIPLPRTVFLLGEGEEGGFKIDSKILLFSANSFFKELDDKIAKFL
jgi:hypothetical protein